MRKRIDAIILQHFLEGWRMSLNNEALVAINEVWAAKVGASIEVLDQIINFVKVNAKTCNNDDQHLIEFNEETIAVFRDYMLEKIAKCEAEGIKYQWAKRTGEVVTLEVSIQKPEQEGSHEEAAGD